MTRTPHTQNIGYVECFECGHPIEDHDATACHSPSDEPCPCESRWTQKEIRRERLAAGLQAKWARG